MVTRSKLKNEYNRLIPALGTIGLFVGVATGIYLGSTNSILIAFSGGLIFFTASIYSVLGRTPKYVEIQNGGIRLIYLVGKDRSINYNEIEHLEIHPPDPPQWRKKYLVGGYAKPMNGRIFVFTREIGYAIREAYREEVGYYPPEKPGVVPWNA